MDSQKETVLIVEDEPDTREAIVDALRQATQYVILEASSGPEALKVCTQHQGKIDLLLTDIIMPGMTGRQLSDMLSAQYPGLEVIFMSSYIEKTRKEAMDQGLHFIQKPFDMKMLESMIIKLLKKKKKIHSP